MSVFIFNQNEFIAAESEACQKLDMNLICNTNLTVQGDTGKCECRQDMRWNEQGGECQVKRIEDLVIFVAVRSSRSHNVCCLVLN